MAYPALFLVLLLLPGWLIAGLAGFRASRALLAPAFSLALLTLDFLALRTLAVPPSCFTPLVATELAVLSAAAVWRRCRPGPRPVARRCRRRAWDLAWPGLLVLAGLAAYLAVAGPYLEAPADAWEHLRRFQLQAACMNADTFAAVGLANFTALDACGRLAAWLTQKSGVWYFLHAWLCRLSGVDVLHGAMSLAFLSPMLWAASLYLFGLKLFAPLHMRRRAKAGMAAFATAFFVLYFGVSIFAYARYYALAPTMPAYVVYLAGVAVILDLIRGGIWRWRRVLAPAVLFLTLNVVHTQEALFLFFMAWGISLAEAARRWWACRRAGASGWRVSPWHAPALALSGAGLLAWLGLFAISHGRPLSPFWELAAMPIQHLLPFLRGMLVQSPVAHFYPVLAVWGVWVYLLFIWRWREFVHLPFMVAGMLMPLLTVFNPVTVDIMLRHFSDPLALYRFNYMLPLPFVAGYCAVRCWPGGRRLRRARLAGAVVWIGLLVWLLPVNTQVLVSEFSRLPTLRSVAPQNDWRHWRDLVEFLDRQPESAIITDQVTAYMLRGATQHHVPGQRFDAADFSWWLRAAEPAMHPELIFAHLTPARRWLLVVNRRDGAPSRTGALSGHWPADVLRTSQYYAPRVVDWVATRPDRFHSLFDANGVRVYEVRP